MQIYIHPLLVSCIISHYLSNYCFEINRMEQNITMLCDVDPMLDDLKVLARCISKWVSHPVGNPSDVWSLDFVLQDTQVWNIQIYAIRLFSNNM